MYVLGPVKPWVRAAADEIGPKFGVRTIYGVGARVTPGSDHPKGLALDFMVYSDRAKGDAIANYAISNIDRLGISYILWQQRIYHRGHWDAMEDRGSNTANHRDHVHISFTADGKARAGNSSGSPTAENVLIKPGVPDIAGLSPLISIVGWLADENNLIRVGVFLGGAALLLLALISMAGVSLAGVGKKAIKMGKAIPNAS